MRWPGMQRRRLRKFRRMRGMPVDHVPAGAGDDIRGSRRCVARGKEGGGDEANQPRDWRYRSRRMMNPSGPPEMDFADYAWRCWERGMWMAREVAQSVPSESDAAGVVAGDTSAMRPRSSKRFPTVGQRQ